MQVSSLFCRPLRLCPGTTVFLMPMMGIFWKLPLKGTEFRDHLQGRAGWSCKGCVQFETGECVWHQISEREILTLGTQILELELRTNQLYLFLSPFLFFSVLLLSFQVHNDCRRRFSKECWFGSHRTSVIPPTALSDPKGDGEYLNFNLRMYFIGERGKVLRLGKFLIKLLFSTSQTFWGSKNVHICRDSSCFFLDL